MNSLTTPLLLSLALLLSCGLGLINNSGPPDVSAPEEHPGMIGAQDKIQVLELSQTEAVGIDVTRGVRTEEGGGIKVVTIVEFISPALVTKDQPIAGESGDVEVRCANYSFRIENLNGFDKNVNFLDRKDWPYGREWQVIKGDLRSSPVGVVAGALCSTSL